MIPCHPVNPKFNRFDSHHSLDGIRMARFALGLSCTFIISLAVGCGSGTPVADNPTAPTQQGITNNVGTPPPASSNPPPTDIVSQFLDEIRRGGEDSRANALLTNKAQSELKRIGQTIQPIGSPNASFEVTRFELHPEDTAAAMVHSVWTEPNAAGGNAASSQVVWALRQEQNGWRISGLAITVDPDAVDPVVFNFEDGTQMAAMLAEPSSDNSEVSSQAAAPESTLNR
ncbi:hypothetical protein OAL64_01270 [bacterium]|nr:hypothetical protein [bacterium]